MIAYRSGIAGFELPVPDDPSRLLTEATGHAAPVAALARPEDGLRLIKQAKGDSFGIVGAPERVTRVQCGRRSLAVVLHETLAGAIAEALVRPSIAGLVALQAESDGSYATALLILSWPKDGYGVHISVNRPSGQTMYFGDGMLEGEAMRFALDAVQAPGAIATTVTGTVAGGQVVQLDALLGETIERLRPTPMDDR